MGKVFNSRLGNFGFECLVDFGIGGGRGSGTWN